MISESKCRINKGLTKGKHKKYLSVAVQEPDCGPPFLHTYIHDIAGEGVGHIIRSGSVAVIFIMRIIIFSNVVSSVSTGRLFTSFGLSVESYNV
jgi:hypothetical protein